MGKEFPAHHLVSLVVESAVQFQHIVGGCRLPLLSLRPDSGGLCVHRHLRGFFPQFCQDVRKTSFLLWLCHVIHFHPSPFLDARSAPAG